MQPTEEMEDGEVEWSRVKTVLDEMMDELGARDREAVLLRFFEGRAFGEIGAALRVSEDAARVRVNRALEKLRGLLEKRGVTSTAAALGGLLAGNAAVAAPAGLAASVTGAALVSAGSVAAGTAVVGASAAGAASTGILSFMTMTKLVTGVACVVAAVSLGTAVFVQTELKRERAQGSIYAREGEIVRQRADELTARLVDAEKRARDVENERDSARKALEEALAKSKEADTKQTMSSARMGLEIANVLYADSGFQEASLKKFLTSVKFKYAPFYRKMGMSKTQVEQFENALLTREQAQIDQNAAARSQKLSISDPSLGKVANPGFEEAYAELRRVLGDDGLKRFSEYENAVGAQGETGGMLAASLYSEAPLTLDQAEMLAEMMVAHRHSEKIGSVTTFTGYKWDEIGAKVAEVLPEAQARFVQQYVERAKADQLWGDYWRAAQQGRPLSEVGESTKAK
jgi:hypothetical protein